MAQAADCRPATTDPGDVVEDTYQTFVWGVLCAMPFCHPAGREAAMPPGFDGHIGTQWVDAVPRHPYEWELRPPRIFVIACGEGCWKVQIC